MACVYFGVRSAQLEKGANCRKCQQQNAAVFTKCTYETNVLISTSVDIDKHGKTVIVPPTGDVPDDKLLVEP